MLWTKRNSNLEEVREEDDFLVVYFLKIKYRFWRILAATILIIFLKFKY